MVINWNGTLVDHMSKKENSFHHFLILYGVVASIIFFAACGGGKKEAPKTAFIPPQPEEDISLSGPAELSQTGQSYEIKVTGLEKEVTPPFFISLEDIDSTLATIEISEVSGEEPPRDIVIEDKRVMFKEMPKLPITIRFELIPSKDMEENREIAPTLKVRDAETQALLMVKELPKIKTVGKLPRREVPSGPQKEAVVNIFEPTDFDLFVAPEEARTGAVVWSASIPGVSLRAKSDGRVEVTSHVCRPFLLEAMTFDAMSGPADPKISIIPVSTLCRSSLTPRLSFKKSHDNNPAGDIKMTFSVPNGQMAVKGLLGTLLEEERFTTNIPYISDPPFTLRANDFGFSNFGRLSGLQLILFSHACPVNADCVLRIEMKEETSAIPNIELVEAIDVSSNGSPMDYSFSTTDDQGVRRVDIRLPNPAID